MALSRCLLPALVVSACLMSACQAPTATDAARTPSLSSDPAATPAQTAAATPAKTPTDSADSEPARSRAGFAPLPPGAPITYGCDDGTEAKVAYRADAATLTLPDGRELRLAKAQSASKGGGEVFIGEAVSLLRDGSNLELHLENAPALICRAHQT